MGKTAARVASRQSGDAESETDGVLVCLLSWGGVVRYCVGLGWGSGGWGGQAQGASKGARS